MSIHNDISTLIDSLKEFLQGQRLAELPAAQPLITKMHRLENELENVILNPWSVGDVTSMLPKLSDDEAREVLKLVERNFDAESGINWDSLLYAAESLGFDTSHAWEDLDEDEPINEQEH